MTAMGPLDSNARALAEGRAISDAPIEKALDFDGMRLEGLTHLAALGGAVWTDFNTHDPGVTLLEALVYALNDLAYRARFPIVDLLARKDGAGPAAPMAAFTAREILPSAPVTALEWRKLIIDVDGVRNAWLKPADRPNQPFFADRLQKKLTYDPPAAEPNARPVRVRGVYTAVLDLADDPALEDLNDATRSWRPTPPGEDALPLEVAFPLWDSWRTAADPDRHLGWNDPWLAGNVAKIEILSTQVLSPELLGAEAQVGVDVGAGVLRQRKVSITVQLLSGLRGNAADRRDFIKDQLEKHAPETDQPQNPLVTYHARLAAAFVVASRVDSLVQERRNLCEDFTEPAAARFEEISVCADLDVQPGADLDETAARLLWAFEQELGTPPRFHSLDQLQADGVPVEEIFSGPRLGHGFLRDEDLIACEPGTEVHGSDLIAAAMGVVPAVVAVRSLVMGAYDVAGAEVVAGEKWRLVLAEDCVARLAPDRCKLVLYKNGIPFAPDREHVQVLLRQLRQPPPVPGTAALDLPVPKGRWRSLDTYVPARFDLPRVYGVGRDGLPKEASDNRRAQAKQLEEFLLLFDQLIASGVGQVRNLDQLLSIAPGITRTFFSADLRPQDPEGTPLHLPPPADPLRDPLAETPEVFFRRRNAFLDHLLARFDEPFAESAAMVATGRRQRIDPGAADAAERYAAIDTAEVESKAAFLRDYPRLSADRGRAFDVRAGAGPWPADALTGLERRARHLLALRHDRRRALVDRFVVIETVLPAGTQYTFTVRNAAGVTVLAGEGVFASPSDVTFAAAAVERAAARDDRYRLDTVGTRATFIVRGDAGQVLARSSADFATDTEATAAARALAAEFAADPDCEGMHVIEHLLLRPEARDEALLEVTIDPSCPVQPEQADAYSLRATVVLPAWTGRFSDVAFRTFVEQTLRREAPAHVFLKICWVDMVALTALEKAWHAWLELLATEAPPPADRAARLSALVEAMSRLSNVYPVATLHDCKEDAGDNPLVLGKNQLGTMKTEGT